MATTAAHGVASLQEGSAGSDPSVMVFDGAPSGHQQYTSSRPLSCSYSSISRPTTRKIGELRTTSGHVWHAGICAQEGTCAIRPN